MPNTHPMPFMVFQFDTVTAGSINASTDVDDSTDSDAKSDASTDADAADWPHKSSWKSAQPALI